MTLLLTSDAPQATDPRLAGGKGAGLARLMQAGFRVPPFLILSADSFQDGKPRPGLETALAAAVPALGPGPYAVRSSGRAEDGAEHSHAGQYDSRLNVPRNGLMDAAAQVWASGFSERVTTYRSLRTGGEAEAPAIVVQAMVPARAAGVAFSADPVSGFRGRSVISAVAGLGEALVSGDVDGEDWVVSAQGGVLSAPPGGGSVLSAEEARAVAALSRQAEAEFGAPQDIEWAIAGGALFILQSRPVTTALQPRAQPDATIVVLDNSNIIESYPDLVSPLTYSFARAVYGRVYRAFVRLLGVRAGAVAQNAAVFDNMLSRVDGRIYYNLGNWYRALALLPGFALNRGHMETMMGVQEPLPAALSATIGPPPATGAARLREMARLAPVGLGLLWQALLLPRTKARFYQRLDQALAGGEALAGAGLTALAADYRRIEALLLDRWDAPLINDFLCMLSFGASRKLLVNWAGDTGADAHNAVMIGQGDIVSAEPARRIATMGALAAKAGLTDRLARGDLSAISEHPELAVEFAAYLERFGDRCTQELKLESIPLGDDPGALLAAIAGGASRPAPPHIPPPPPDWSRLIPRRPVRRAFARWLTLYAAARVRDRENLRFERTRIFGHARRVFLAIGRELAAGGHLLAPRDIFMLTVDEVLGLIEGSGLGDAPAALAAQRRAGHDAAATRPDPPERLVLAGAVGPAVAARSADTAAAPPDPAAPVWEMRGTGCSAGLITARARVITDPRRQSLDPGDILVARNTDPGWIAVFANAAGIVVERGSLLSHSAIVARELGIPCVVGIRGATTWIADGEDIEIDGTNGTVRKIHGHGGDCGPRAL